LRLAQGRLCAQSVDPQRRRPVPVRETLEAPRGIDLARPAGTRLPSPPPNPRRRRAEALEIDPRDRLAGTARVWCECGRHSADGRACVSLWPAACPRGNLPLGGARAEPRLSPGKRPRRAKRTARRRSRTPHLRAIEATLADVAHEIRTPLTGILALGELLATSELGARERG